MVPGRLGQQYRLIRLIGAGGMGAVYEGFDDGLCRKIAVKVILREKVAEDPSFIESFRREAQAAARLNSPNIVAVYAFGEADGQPYLVMELVQTDALDKMMASGPMMPATALNVCMQIAQGLRAASEQGLVHGDVKPENILINEAREAKLADFGIAALAGANAAANNEVWGTPYYIAPETLRKQKIDLRADIYSLGGTLYHAIAGVPPFEGADAVEVMKARLLGPVRPITELRPDCPEGIAKIMMRMLQPELIRRYPNYDSLLNDMRKELRTAHASIGGGKRIVIKGKNVTGPITMPSAPMTAVQNVNAPLIEKKSRLGLWIGLGVGGAILLITSILLLIFLGGDKEASDTKKDAPSVATTPSATENDTSDTGSVDTITPAKEKASQTLKAALLESEKMHNELETAINEVQNIIADVKVKATPVTWETDVQWLEPQTTEEGAPTSILRTLQSAYTTLDTCKELYKKTDQQKKTLSVSVEQIPTESVEAIDAYVNENVTQWKTFKEDEALKKYASDIKTLKRAASNMRNAIREARNYCEKRQKEKEQEAETLREAERQEKLAEQEAKLAETEINSVKRRLENTVTRDLAKFMPETAREAYNSRIKNLNLKTEAGKAAAHTILMRIEAVDLFKTWRTTSITKGTLKLPGLFFSEVTPTTLKVNGQEKEWKEFLASADVLKLYNYTLKDNASSLRFTNTQSMRADLCVSALYMMELFIKLENIEESKTLQDYYSALLNIANETPRAKARLEALQLAFSLGDEATSDDASTSEE
jgi:hypothetical protein